MLLKTYLLTLAWNSASVLYLRKLKVMNEVTRRFKIEFMYLNSAGDVLQFISIVMVLKETQNRKKIYRYPFQLELFCT